MGKKELLWMLLNAALRYMSAERMKRWVAFGIGELKEAIEEDGRTDWKDRIVLPILNNLEEAFDLEEE